MGTAGSGGTTGPAQPAGDNRPGGPDGIVRFGQSSFGAARPGPGAVGPGAGRPGSGGVGASGSGAEGSGAGRNSSGGSAASGSGVGGAGFGGTGFGSARPAAAGGAARPGSKPGLKKTDAVEGLKRQSDQGESGEDRLRGGESDREAGELEQAGKRDDAATEVWDAGRLREAAGETRVERAVSDPELEVRHRPGESDGPGGDGPGGDDHGSGRGFSVPGGRRTLVVGAAALGGLFAVYLGVALLNSERVADGTTVAGVAVGGMTHDETVNTLNQAYEDLNGKIGLTAAEGDDEQDVAVEDLGVELDARRIADDLTGFTLNPVRLMRHLTSGDAIDPSPYGGSTDPIDSGLASFRKKATRAAEDASLTFEGTTVTVVKSQDGYELSDTAADAVRAGWLTGAVELPVRATHPQHGTADAQALKTAAETAVSAPVTVRVGDTDVEIPPARLSAYLTTRDDDGALSVFVDGDKLKKLVLKQEPGIETKAVDAKFVVKNGKPSIVADRDGLTVDEDSLAEKVRDAMFHDSAPDRIAVVGTRALKAELTEAKAGELGVKERVSTFSTNLTSDAKRTENLRVAARTVDGTLVLPGETFSLNQVLGERTAAKGYNQAPAISGGRLVQDYGGGVSQMATTIFNNVFFAGLEDVYHKPHSFYISRYPEGREATVNWPTVDLKWKNDTDTAVLIKASVGSQVTVSFYGTKYWDITAGKSERTNYRTPETVYDDSAGCVAQGANTGFDVSVTRTFRKPGSDDVVRTVTFKAVYNAEDEVICGPDPATETEDEDKAGDESDETSDRTAQNSSQSDETDQTTEQSEQNDDDGTDDSDPGTGEQDPSGWWWPGW